MHLESKKKSLFKNTVMLYILTFSKYLLGFITVPYETRVLGPEKYGLIGLATAFMMYFELLIDFGFLLSATEQVARHRDNKAKVSSIFTSVIISKIVLSCISLVIVLILCSVVSAWREHTLFFVLFFISISLGSMLPDFLYRGMEQMSAITVRTVCIQLFFTVMIFCFVKQQQDYLVYPVIKIIGNAVSIIVIYWHLRTKHKIKFIKISFKEAFSNFKYSASFFLSRIATTVYSAMNTIILDFVSGGAMTGYYTSANRLVNTARGGLAPIADSLYPYMIKNKDYKLVRKILVLIEPIILIGCVILFIFARPICVWFFGAEFYFTADALRTLIPIIAITLPSYIFGFPILSAMGLSKYANYSVILASIVHSVNILILFALGKANIISLGIITSISEYIVFIYRLFIVYKNRDKMRKEV